MESETTDGPASADSEDTANDEQIVVCKMSIIHMWLLELLLIHLGISS